MGGPKEAARGDRPQGGQSEFDKPMGTISSSTGLISGLDIESLVSSLIAVETRPITLLENQKKGLEAERTAFMTVSARLLSLKLSVVPFKSGVTFRPRSASSSDENVLTAKASSSASPGSYSFRVRQLAQTHQMVSSGFSDPDLSPISPGTITIEMGQGRLDRETELNFLNGHQGVRRGVIRITDRSGGSAEVDLGSAVTVQDVIDQINQTSGISVRASIDGDRLVLTDQTGQSTGNLIVEDMHQGYAAQDLGIAGIGTEGVITGQDLVRITETTTLKALNDGAGVRSSRDASADLHIKLHSGVEFDVGLPEALTLDTSLSMLNRGKGVRLGAIQITMRNGDEKIVDLTGATTLGDVASKISTATDGKVTLGTVGTGVRLSDSTGGEGTLKIENFGGSYAASDLGIDKESEEGQAIVSGDDIFFTLSTVGDVIRAVQDAADRSAAGPGALTARVAADGKRIELIDNTTGAGAFEISSANESGLAEDLGLAGVFDGSTAEGRRVVSGLNAVLLRSLNGGSGVELGQIRIQDRTGGEATLDLSTAETLDDVLAAINNSPDVNVRAELNQAGTGIVVRDMTGATTGNFRISGAMAEQLGIAYDGEAATVDSGNNQFRYVSENTLLSELNGGRGISSGSFTVTDSTGNQKRFAVASNNDMTVGALVDMINKETAEGRLNVTASINANGDGILLTDTGDGAGTLTVADNAGGRTARDLRIAGKSETPGNGTIDGSYEYRIEVDSGDGLQAVVDKINALGVPIKAGIINDGSQINGYRLSLSSELSGKDGRMIVNWGQTDLAMFDLVKPQDAVIAFGGAGYNNPIVASSSTNTFTGTIPGVTLNVQAVSDKPVTVTVATDVDGVVAKIDDFVAKFNEVIDLITQLTDYDPETEEAGVLLGETTVDLVKTRLYNTLRAAVQGVGDLDRVSELGISVGTGGKLQFDEEKFRTVYENDPDAVEEFFSSFDQDKYRAAAADGEDALDRFYANEPMGFGHVMDRLLDVMTRTDGIIARKTSSYQRRESLFSDRIEYLEEMLERKEQRLYQQFYNMELALSRMQEMQSALSSYTPISPITTSSSTSRA